jgi:hypothetical protein
MALPMPNSPLARMRKMELIHSHQARLQELQQIEAAKAQEMMEAGAASPGVPGGASRGPVGGDMPVRPQEMPNGNTEGEAMAGVMSLLGGNTGQ